MSGDVDYKILSTILEALKHTDDGILINDWDENIIYCNRSFLMRLGFDLEKDYRGVNLRDLLPEDLHSILDEFRENVLKYGKYSASFDAEVKGKMLKVHALSTLIRTMEPHVVVSVIRDVTGLENAWMGLEERSRELAFLNEIYSRSNELLNLREILIEVMSRLREFCNGITYAVYRMCDDGEKAELISSHGIPKKYLDMIRVIDVKSRVQQAMLASDGVIVLDEDLKDVMVHKEWIRDDLGIMRTLAFNFRLRGDIVYFAYIGLGEDRDVPKELRSFVTLAKDQLNNLLERIFLLDELKKRESELKNLTNQILNSMENEKRNIAIALHDETEQYIAAANMDIDVLERKIDVSNEEVAGLLNGVRDKLNHISVSTKKISSALHPSMLEDLGLVPTLQWFIDEFVRRDGINVNFEAVGFDERLPAQMEVVLYRVAQEALTNIIKHADAGEVNIKLTKGYPDVILLIEDDGRGFDVSEAMMKRGGLGLAGMRERVDGLGGTLKIKSSPGKGTRIRVTFPMGVDYE